MIPAFALVFSEDTVTLLHREDDWTPLGDAALGSPDLSERLVDLRALAEARAGDAFATRLIVPASQVLFTTVPLTGEEDADAQVLAALDGLTPYAVSELVHDWQAEGRVAHLAIVARETLHEVEGFATDHGFNPVAFGAIAPGGRRPAEPWFGPTMVAPRFLGGDVAGRDPMPLPVAPVLPEGQDDVRVPARNETVPEHVDPPAPLWAEPEPVALPDGHDAFATVRTHPEDVRLLPEDEAPREDPEGILPEDIPEPVVEDDPLPEDAPTADDLPLHHVDDGLQENPVPASHLAWDEAPHSDPAPEDDPEAHPAPEEPEPEAPAPLSIDDALPEQNTQADLGDRSPAQVVPELQAAHPERPEEGPLPEVEPPVPEAQARTGAPAIPAPVPPLPVFDHPSFLRKPPLRAERDVGGPRTAGPRNTKIAPPVTSAEGEAPFIDFGRSAGAPTLDMTPPPLRVTQTRAQSLAPRPAVRERPRYLGIVMTVVLLALLAIAAAASAYFIEDTTEPVARVEQAPKAPEFRFRLGLISAAHAQERPASSSGSLMRDNAFPAPDPELAGVTPRARPSSLARAEAAPTTTGAASVFAAQEGSRPRLRPGDLDPTAEELTETADAEGALAASPRPPVRPESAANAAITAPSGDGTALAVAVSQRPETRPSGVSRASVNAALAAALEPPPAAAPPAPAAVPTLAPAQLAAIATPRVASPRAAPPPPAAVPQAPRTAAPNIPTRASVAQQATETGALPLGRTNVISITGASSNRTALVRASNGRISRLQVGDRLDGGVVAAITQNAIHYRKGNTLYALEMPG